MGDRAIRPDCVFCKIIVGEAGADVVFRDEQIVAFRDIRPVAPVHLLVVPARHIDSLIEARGEDQPLMGQLIAVAQGLALREGLNERGYRLVLNAGREAGQSVFHVHLHLLGGRAMHWPPG